MNKPKLPLVLLIIFIVNLLAVQMAPISIDGEVSILVTLWAVNMVIGGLLLLVPLAKSAYEAKRLRGDSLRRNEHDNF